MQKLNLITAQGEGYLIHEQPKIDKRNISKKTINMSEIVLSGNFSSKKERMELEQDNDNNLINECKM